jgi:hypothetical protein
VIEETVALPGGGDRTLFLNYHGRVLYLLLFLSVWLVSFVSDRSSRLNVFSSGFPAPTMEKGFD